MHLLHSNYSYLPLDRTAAARSSCYGNEYPCQDKGLLYDTTAVLDNLDCDELRSRVGDEAELDALLDRMLDIQTCGSSYGGGESGSSNRFYNRPHHQGPEQEQPQPLVAFSGELTGGCSGFNAQLTEEGSERSWNSLKYQAHRSMQTRDPRYPSADHGQSQLHSPAPCSYGSSFYPPPSDGPDGPPIIRWTNDYNPLCPRFYQCGIQNYDAGAALNSFAAPNSQPQVQQAQIAAGFGTEPPRSAAVRPLSAVALHRQKLFQLGRTISSPEMPTPPLVAAAAAVASPQSLSSSSSSLYFPPPSGQLSHSLPCVDRSASGLVPYPWAATPYHVAAASSLFLPQQRSGSPSPSQSDSRSPPESAAMGASVVPLLSPFGDTSFVFHAHQTASPPGSAGQQMLCAVCGDTAACQHYGVRTCEGCKGFFKRTVQKNSKYVCLANRDCIIDKRRRNRCQYCRFQKCLAMGMVKEVVRTDSLKGRRGRLPSKSKLTSEEGSGVTGGPTQLQPLTKALVNAFMSNGSSPSGSDYGRSVRQGVKENFVESLIAGLTCVHNLVERIPGWCNIDERDRALLLKHSALYALSLKIAYKSMPVASDQKMLTDDGHVYTLDECPAVWHPWFQAVLSLSVQFRESLELDLTAFCCLCALSLVFQDHSGLRKVEEVDKLKNSLINCLKEHCTYSPEAKNKPQYFARIFSKLTELHTVCRCAKEAYAATVDTKYTPAASSSLSTNYFEESFID